MQLYAVDYFTKWTEAEHLATITSKKVLDFVVKNIICQYGMPRKIVSDNGTQFDSDLFTNFCNKNGIIKSFSSVAHHQANGQVEAVNKILKSSLKKKLEEAKVRWPEELPQVLWAYRTMARTSTGHTPFSLAYGCEAMLPIEVKIPTIRALAYDQTSNHSQLEETLDLIEERRNEAQLKNDAYEQRATWYFNKRVRDRTFGVGDLVLRRVFLATQDLAAGVLGPNWEGPY